VAESVKTNGCSGIDQDLLFLVILLLFLGDDGIGKDSDLLFLVILLLFLGENGGLGNFDDQGLLFLMILLLFLGNNF